MKNKCFGCHVEFTGEHEKDCPVVKQSPMTPDEVVAGLDSILKLDYCIGIFNEQVLSTAISLIQDYQKLRGRVSVEKIEKICFDHISLGTSEYYKMLPINLAQAIVNYLGGQPNEKR